MRIIEDLGMIYPTETSKHKSHYAIYECPYCGNPFRAVVYDVRANNVKSCGCRRLLKTKGFPNRRLVGIWKKMIWRCCNPNYQRYDRYGGRGIAVCNEWKNDYYSFYNWSMANGYADNLTIDRKDNDSGYCPENCRWVTMRENSQNKSKKSGSKNKYKGVRRSYNTWSSRISYDGMEIYLGNYKTEEEAALAYNNWIIKHKTYHALNIIEDERTSTEVQLEEVNVE